MRKNSIIVLILVSAIAAGALLSGCEAQGRTEAEVNLDHRNRIRHDMWQTQDDVDAVLMLDRPSRLSDKVVR